MQIKIIHKIYADGRQVWLLNDEFHREDGPAYIGINGRQEWYLNDKRVHSTKDYQQKLKLSDEDVTILILKYGDIK